MNKKAATYARWIMAITGLVLVAAGVTYYGMSRTTATSVLHKACDYWDGHGGSQWCKEPLLGQLVISKCGTRLYLVETQNNPCSDLIITGGGGVKYYTLPAHKRNSDVQKQCGYVQRGGCR